MLPMITEMRILIADDNDLVRRGLIRLLSAETGWTVCGEARDGFEALQKARELLPDLILLDLRMPGMNGLDATRRLRLELPEAHDVFRHFEAFRSFALRVCAPAAVAAVCFALAQPR
jgi:DNA-binding NarL/FixJ family response regulator